MDPGDYYNQESIQYSHKRYEGVTDTYVKYFFKRRLELVLGHLAECQPIFRTLLDVGTGDGVMLREITSKLSGKFNKLVGVDIADEMIKQSRLLTTDNAISFFNVNDTPKEKFDVILFIGFMTPKLWQDYQSYVTLHLAEGGFVLTSFAGHDSIHARLKIKNEQYYVEYLSYQNYRKLIGTNFEIINSKYYGFFVPKLWSIPALARVVQPIVDRLMAPLFPNLFHECLYLLRKK